MGSKTIRSSHRKIGAMLLALTLVFAAEGCKKKVPPPPPPPTPVEPVKPPPKPAAPKISEFEAEPSTVERGQPSTLRWAVTGQATEITIAPGLGTVSATGNRQVFPSSTTQYTLTAKGPGGADSRSVTVTVTQPAPPPPPPEPTPRRTISQILAEDVKDVYFDYDKSEIREDARAQLARNADVFKQLFQEYPNAALVLEGHCDERGSAEYNLGLGDRRATAVREFLIQLGVPTDKLKPVSYGKERPQCTESNESCWQMNRRVHFSAGS
ncbi:MAG: OmpA family protein [Acidobacteria bacterium]|nr:OmpA family protein [Acidobacteriota bacterium]MBI3280617.1 OmpA family protein [Acidobacteriota bacterium]